MRRILLVALLSSGIASAQTAITFAAKKEGGERIKALSVHLGGGRLATIAVVGTDPEKAALVSGEALNLLGHDPVTRMTILQGPNKEQPVASPRASSLGLQPGDAVYLPSQKRASRVVRWENTFRGKILPVALIRIHHPFDQPPLPGTPLANAKGEVVAVCHEPAPKFGNGTFALPIEVVNRVEHDHKATGRVTTCWIGVTVNAINPVLAVEMVRPNSPGAAAGVKKGDILLSVGPRQVSTYAEARDAFYYMLIGEATDLTILRGTKRLELKVIPEVHPAYAPADE